MTQNVDSLTEKEKDALRLLFTGHDAKSTATALNISVHTVNDRLRNARRKLSVSSSREAARILRDAEGVTPQILAHSDLRSVSAAVDTDSAGLTQTRRTGPLRLLWLAGGMLVMSVSIALAVVVAVSTNGADTDGPETETQAVAPADPDSAESIASIEAFLDRVDAGDWEGSWEAAGPSFQSQVTAAEWEQQIEPLRGMLGDVQSRELVSVQMTQTLPGAADGTYEVVRFETLFAGASGPVTESVIAMAGEQGWEVVGYFMR